MAKNAIRLECQITSFRSRADGSLGASLCTQELSVEEKITIMQLQGMLLEALFIPIGEKDAELVEAKGEMDLKTPSQRLRNCLFVWFKELQKTGLKDTFDVFYAKKMEAVIEFVKSKIDSSK